MTAEASMEQVYWSDIRSRVQALNPELAKVIDDIDPGRTYSFFLAKYPFGVKIFDQGLLYFPDTKKFLLANNDSQLDTHIAKHLNYSFFPVTLILKKNLEVFIEPADRMVPIRLLGEGALIGLWETLKPAIYHSNKQSWSISSGARSLFLLPKITDAANHSRLRRDFAIRSSVPRSLSAHWKIFTELANHRSFATPWESELLFFSGKWFEENKGQAWDNFNYCLYKHAWMQTLNYRNKEILNYIWEDFNLTLTKKNLKPKPHLIDTFKHMICMAMGLVPGFRPADNNEGVGPLNDLQDIYVNVYGLKQYIPTIMQPFHLSATANLPVYYSLQSPTLIENYPKPKAITSIISDMRELKSLTDSLYDCLNLEKSVIYHFLENIQFDYFHNEMDELTEIYNSRLLPVDDPAFTYWKGRDAQRQFSDNSPFVKGCIRVKFMEK